MILSKLLIYTTINEKFTMNSKIILENIKIYAYHGVLPEEQIIGTYYLVNAEIHANLWKATQSDNLEDTINYAHVSKIIHEEMKIPSQLLEHVSGRIIHKIESEFSQVSFVKIRVTKLQPPMYGEFQGVSVEFEKNIR